MATLVMHWSGDGIARIQVAMDTLASPRKYAGLRRAINHTGDKCYTIVKRTLTKQMGLSSQKLFKDGRTLVKRRASGGHFEYQIVSGGRAVRANEFRHHIHGKGITFYPWGNKHNIRSAFVINRGAAWAKGTLKNTNFYRRRTKSRFPLEALYGPNLNKELVKDATAAAFYQVAGQLPARVEHEIRVITNGVVS